MHSQMFVYFAKLNSNCSLVLVFCSYKILSEGCDVKEAQGQNIVTKNAMKSVRDKLSENCRRFQK